MRAWLILLLFLPTSIASISAAPLFYGEDERGDQFLETASYDIQNVTVDQKGNGTAILRVQFDEQTTMGRRMISITLGGQDTISLNCITGDDTAGQQMQDRCYGDAHITESGIEDGELLIRFNAPRAFVSSIGLYMQSAYTLQNPATYAELGGPVMDGYESDAWFQLNQTQTQELGPLELAPNKLEPVQAEAKETPYPLLAPLLLLLRPRR